ncbi:hypothetical protein [Slackia isoflavoniconvertens]|uniref:hypothetical protein n=1 Tax=Slackia isoflavoniconvertens TaxID=572010 RepID=UPI002E77279E|nr:hypothetical protein [Slackia isoflavoniconvertens]
MQTGKIQAVRYDAVKTEHLGWPKAEIEGTKKGFVIPSHKDADHMESLKNGFWQWELLKVNPNDSESLRTFCQNYGIPCHPMRICKNAFIPSTKDNAERAIAKTNKANGCISDNFGSASIVSIDEVRAAIIDLQASARCIAYKVLELATGLPISRIGHHKEASLYEADRIDLICLCAKPDSISLGSREKSRSQFVETVYNVVRRADLELTGETPSEWKNYSYNLTQAICFQIYEDMNSKDDWHICDKCGMPFKRPSIKASREQTTRTTKERKTCSDSCTGSARRIASI